MTFWYSFFSTLGAFGSLFFAVMIHFIRADRRATVVEQHRLGVFNGFWAIISEGFAPLDLGTSDKKFADEIFAWFTDADDRRSLEFLLHERANRILQETKDLAEQMASRDPMEELIQECYDKLLLSASIPPAQILPSAPLGPLRRRTSNTGPR